MGYGWRPGRLDDQQNIAASDDPAWRDNSIVILTLDSKRRLTVPAGLAPAKPGDHFQAEFNPEEDAIVFRRIARDADWLGVLKRCPVKMHDLPPRGRAYPKRLQL